MSLCHAYDGTATLCEERAEDGKWLCPRHIDDVARYLCVPTLRMAHVTLMTPVPEFDTVLALAARRNRRDGLSLEQLAILYPDNMGVIRG